MKLADRAAPAPLTRRARLRRWARDDRGVTVGFEALFGVLFMLLFIFFITQVVVWWHAKNVVEQAAATAVQTAATATATCGDAEAAAQSITETIAGGWVNDVTVSCSDSTTGGELVTVTVSARTPLFAMAGSLPVSARATAPAETPPGGAP